MIVISLGNYLIAMKSLCLYLKKRFPILPLSLFTLLTITGMAKTTQTQANYGKIILLSLVYISFLFHLRLLDEFKDYEYDNEYHPNRPVQCGEISLNQIKILGIVNFIVMLIASIMASDLSITPVFLLVIFYSLIMYKEFFIKNFYERTATLYLISHQIVFIPLYSYFYSSLNSSLWHIDNVNKLFLFGYTLIPVVLIEIGRKMSHRFDEQGNKTNDTYAFVWGERKTIVVFSILIILSGLFSFYIDEFSSIFSWLIIVLGMILFTGSFLFQKQILKFNMVLTIIFALGFPALLLI